MNAIVVTVPEKALDHLVRNSHVAGIEVDVERSLIEPKRITVDDKPSEQEQTIPYGIDAVQARDVWDKNKNGVIDKGAPTGAGVTVYIIDTGFYNEHVDLDGVELVGGMSHIPDEDITDDGYGHGTHVAGTITAMNNDLGVVGVTPGTASLYIVKIFDYDGNWVSKAHASDLVAAIDSGNTVADFSKFNEQVELAAPGVSVLSTVPFLDISSLTVDNVEYSGFQMTYAPSGTATGELVYGGLCGETGDLTGMVVLCQRGDFLGTLGGEGEYIPVISLSKEVGEYLVSNIHVGQVSTIVSEISKPDSGYEAWDGTSMAAPHVSGMAALVWSAFPELNNVEIRESLDATAFDLGDPGRDVYYGFGLVQAFDAIQ